MENMSRRASFADDLSAQHVTVGAGEGVEAGEAVPGEVADRPFVAVLGVRRIDAFPRDPLWDGVRGVCQHPFGKAQGRGFEPRFPHEGVGGLFGAEPSNP